LKNKCMGDWLDEDKQKCSTDPGAIMPNRVIRTKFPSAAFEIDKVIKQKSCVICNEKELEPPKVGEVDYKSIEQLKKEFEAKAAEYSARDGL
jgi:hypothetical protein